MKTIKLEDSKRQLVARKRELGIVGVDFLPFNDGSRRTPSKRQLLRTIAVHTASQGRISRFPANCG